MLMLVIMIMMVPPLLPQALNVSRSILKRRLRVKDKEREQRQKQIERMSVAQPGRKSMMAPAAPRAPPRTKEQSRARLEVAQEGGAGMGDGADAGDDGGALASELALTTEWPWLSRPEIKLSNLREVTTKTPLFKHP